MKTEYMASVRIGTKSFHNFEDARNWALEHVKVEGGESYSVWQLLNDGTGKMVQLTFKYV